MSGEGAQAIGHFNLHCECQFNPPRPPALPSPITVANEWTLTMGVCACPRLTEHLVALGGGGAVSSRNPSFSRAFLLPLLHLPDQRMSCAILSIVPSPSPPPPVEKSSVRGAVTVTVVAAKPTLFSRFGGSSALS